MKKEEILLFFKESFTGKIFAEKIEIILDNKDKTERLATAGYNSQTNQYLLSDNPIEKLDAIEAILKNN